MEKEHQEGLTTFRWGKMLVGKVKEKKNLRGGVLFQGSSSRKVKKKKTRQKTVRRNQRRKEKQRSGKGIKKSRWENQKHPKQRTQKRKTSRREKNKEIPAGNLIKTKSPGKRRVGLWTRQSVTRGD